MEIHIRNGEPRDADAVLGLMKQLAGHEGLAHFFVLTPEGLHRACFEPPPRMELLVAERAGEVVGYASYLSQFSPWLGRDYLFLDDLYVRDDLRGLGVGTLLMRALGAIALERDAGVRWHVEPENQPAQRFYRALGAELREKRIAYWLVEAIRAQLG